MSTPFTFILPAELAAKAPPERRGIARDKVQLMIIDRASYRKVIFGMSLKIST